MFKIIDSEKVNNSFLKIYRSKFVFDNGEVLTREYMNSRGAASMIVFDPKSKELAFVKQFRIGPAMKNEDPYILDFVAGIIDGNDETLDTAIRETKEEIGVIHLSNIEKVLSPFFTAIHRSSGMMSMFYSESDLSKIPKYTGNKEENEFIEVVKLDLNFACNNLHLFPTSAGIVGMLWLKNKFNM